MYETLIFVCGLAVLTNVQPVQAEFLKKSGSRVTSGLHGGIRFRTLSDTIWFPAYAPM